MIRLWFSARNTKIKVSDKKKDKPLDDCDGYCKVSENIIGVRDLNNDDDWKSESESHSIGTTRLSVLRIYCGVVCVGDVKLWNADCLQAMQFIPDGSVDMVLCDPPYGTTACKWDTVIPFEPMWGQLKRIIKPNGAICLFGTQPFTSMVVSSNLSMFKYCWTWDKGKVGGFTSAKLKPLKLFEDVCVGDVKLWNADCLQAMQFIPDGSVDMVLCDPPYGTTACKWDSVIPFEPMWEQINRIIKPIVTGKQIGRAHV